MEGYYNRVLDKADDGKMDKEDFIEMFEVAFPERPKDRIQKLAVQLANQEGKICELLFVTTVLP